MEEIGRGLGGMVDVALEVDDRGMLMEDPRFEALPEGGADLAHIPVALAEEHVVADADRFGEEGDHRGGLAHGFAVGDLGLDLVEFGESESEGVDGGGEAEAGAG
ncbi:MAG: hypothetical protein BWY77_00611 [bacterium ADurb.Bin431]|nr:MAG: hypothetical protein BWY77_00611 [bacterium ADurb.Bin431]